MSPPFGGVADSDTCKKLIAYLKSISPADASSAH
jgi:hypothetical protein